MHGRFCQAFLALRPNAYPLQLGATSQLQRHLAFSFPFLVFTHGHSPFNTSHGNWQPHAPTVCHNAPQLRHSVPPGV